MVTMQRRACFSQCGKYRYSLTRQWNVDRPSICWIMLNPSTADGFQDDPTIRRCIGFSQSWGAGGIEVVNLFAFRATQPTALFAARNPIGPQNDGHLIGSVTRPDRRVIAAWGCHGGRGGRDLRVLALLLRHGVHVECLGRTKDGHPRHPLYVPGRQATEPMQTRDRWPRRLPQSQIWPSAQPFPWKKSSAGPKPCTDA